MRYRWISYGVTLAVAVTLSGSTPIRAEQTVGLFLNDEDSFDGYTLFGHFLLQITYLIGNDGKQVHSWASDFPPGLSAYLLENGHLLRTARFAPGGSPFNTGGAAIR